VQDRSQLLEQPLLGRVHQHVTPSRQQNYRSERPNLLAVGVGLSLGLDLVQLHNPMTSVRLPRLVPVHLGHSRPAGPPHRFQDFRGHIHRGDDLLGRSLRLGGLRFRDAGQQDLPSLPDLFEFVPGTPQHRLDQSRAFLLNHVPEGGPTDQTVLTGGVTHVGTAQPGGIMEQLPADRHAQPSRQFLMMTRLPGRLSGDLRAPVDAMAEPSPFD
jgi:hypothetical protein